MFQSMLRRFTQPRRGASAHSQLPFHPWLEWLEGRETPAIIVNTFADVVDGGDGKTSLREAISQANTNANADTILLKAGTYKIGILGANEDANARGDFDITNPLTIKRSGLGVVTIDGQSLDRVFHVFEPVAGTINVTFDKVRIKNGLSTGSGGGIRVAGNTGTVNLTVKNSTLSGNRANSNGGAIYAQEALTLTKSKVTGNFAGSNGGGVNVFGTLTVSASIISGNTAGSNGGGVYGLSPSQLAFTSSTVSGNNAGNNGGGIHINSDSTLTLTQSTVSGNTAGNTGGGFSANSNSIVTVSQSTISGNSAGNSGGGGQTNSNSTVSVTGSSISGNTAGNNGGGLYALTGSTVTFTGSSVRNNSAGGSGGGIKVNSGGSLSVTTTTFHNNTATSSGGGIETASEFTIQRSTLSGNHAGGNGGGLYATAVGNATRTITSATFSGNTAQGSGGGLYLDMSTFIASLLNVTIAFNRAHDGGGVLAATGTVFVKNTIIGRNTIAASGVGPDVNGAFTSIGNNLIGIGDGSSGFIITDQVGSTATPLNPRLGPLANNGGPTLTHLPQANSDAVDQGNNVAAPATDQRGKTRPEDGDGNGVAVVDIGAVER